MPHDELPNIDENLPISDDFFQGDIAQGLEKMRKRLLDLSNSNRLLNFKHPKGSSLRVVDEIPDFLYERLIDGAELSFRPVPKPRQNDLWKAEVAKDIDAVEFAKVKGIDTSYELTHRNLENRAELPRNLIDNEIQTLHFPEKLEALVGRISNNARLAIEETGTNMLYLVFGFLEWFEDDISESAHLAPLFLLPVSLRRGNPDLVSHTYKYFLSYSGEDIVTNISLQEKMKSEFSLKIPDIKDEQTPESYFSKFTPILKKFDRWKVRRFVTLTLLSFGKLLMYRDLDPDLWPKKAKISDHPRIREFFEGIQCEEITHAPEYDLDELAPPEEPPLVIDNADSSQHSAIIDALKGKNLVIEGPPGTGKSQTITNLIASVLTEGKSVLFVSEKLAALEVVRRRLDKCGLGSFCLELHSNKTKKQELLKDIEKRIELRRSFRDIETLDGKLQLLHSQRQLLHQYAKLISEKFGSADIRIFDLIWRRQRLLTKTGISVDKLKKLVVLNARDLDQLAIEQRTHNVGLFATHLSHVLEAIPEAGAGKLRLHPFWGMNNGRLSFTEQQSLADLILQLTSTGNKLIDTARNLMDIVIGNRGAEESELFEISLSNIRQFIAGVDSLNGLRGPVCAAIFGELKSPQVRERLGTLIENISVFRELHGEITAVVGSDSQVFQGDIESAFGNINQISALVPLATTIADLQTLSEVLEQHLKAIDNSTRAIQEFADLTNSELHADRRGLETSRAAIEMLERAPFEHLHYRHLGLTSASAVSILDQAHREALSLKATRDWLETNFNLSLVPESHMLGEHLAICANAGWLRFFSRDYRNTKKAYRTFSRVRERRSKESMHDDFQSLWDFRHKVEKFESNAEFQSVCGAHFKGVDTDLAGLLSVALWFKELDAQIGAGTEQGTECAHSLWNLEARKVKQFQFNRRNDLTEKIIGGINSIDACPKLLPNIAGESVSILAELSNLLVSLAHSFDALIALFRRKKIPCSLSLAEAHDLFDKCEKRNELERTILSDGDSQSVLKEHFGGISTDTTVLSNTLYFFESIEQSGLNEWIIDWLESHSVTERLGLLRSEASSLRDHFVSFNSKNEEFVKLAKIDIFQWYRAHRQFNDIALSSILRRLTESGDNFKFLSEWVLYLASREVVTSESGGERLVSEAEEGAILPSNLTEVFQLAVYNSLLQEVFEDSPELQQFSGLSHETLREAFAKLDRNILRLFQQRAAYVINSRQVPIGIGRGPVGTLTDHSLLEHEIRKQKRHIPIRQLVSRAGNALKALKPCFMMGPLSVAQYLPPGQFNFDFVVMDEASQLKPEDALGAIARGKQVVIVGDRKQLPPTSFFDRIGDDEDEEAEENIAQSLQDAESILDVASAVYQPSRMLRWHYRSRHASLIAFSNQEFYREKLIVFPSPESKAANLGVKFTFIGDGVYSARHNVKEAESVVESIFDHIEKNPGQSLGVVSLNSVQRDVIDDLFKQKLKERSYGENYLNVMKNRSEPFFVKNLENVQGDERDVIFVSITFGPDANGRVFQRFGPINSDTGHRRLNVLFTRSRFRLNVFSSMRHDQVLVSEDSKPGIRALKKYLEFAETGILQSAQFSGREPDSDFEIEVASALNDRGYDVVAQVGVAGFYIDLAVKHPNISDTFVLGIECDGAMYHSSRSARDRDRLREEILNGLGWKLHRIWSTDWFRNPEHELDRIVQKLAAATRNSF